MEKTTEKTPAISVLMSVHNGEKHLREAIDSILAQTFSDFEFIIVNDASTDGTANILNSYTDPRIKIITNTENIGLTKSLNKGLKEAQGTYIARMDADDISLPNRFQIQKDFLDRNANITCVGGTSIIIDENGNETGSKKAIVNTELLKFHMMLKNQISHPSTLFRRKDIVDSGSYNENFAYAQDYELWSRLLQADHKISNIVEPVLKYRFHSSSITQSKNGAHDFALKTIRKNIEHYIAISEEQFTTLTDSLHKHKVSSFRKLMSVRKILDQFSTYYVQKEKVSTTNKKHIDSHIKNLKRQALRWYIKGKFRSRA